MCCNSKKAQVFVLNNALGQFWMGEGSKDKLW
jgi:hypothetical protein